MTMTRISHITIVGCIIAAISIMGMMMISDFKWMLKTLSRASCSSFNLIASVRLLKSGLLVILRLRKIGNKAIIIVGSHAVTTSWLNSSFITYWSLVLSFIEYVVCIPDWYYLHWNLCHSFYCRQFRNSNGLSMLDSFRQIILIYIA